jgi:hypothetical protein
MAFEIAGQAIQSAGRRGVVSASYKRKPAIRGRRTRAEPAAHRDVALHAAWSPRYGLTIYRAGERERRRDAVLAVGRRAVELEGDGVWRTGVDARDRHPQVERDGDGLPRRNPGPRLLIEPGTSMTRPARSGVGMTVDDIRSQRYNRTNRRSASR